MSAIAAIIAVFEFYFPQPPICLQYHLDNVKYIAQVNFSKSQVESLELKIEELVKEKNDINNQLERRAILNRKLLHAQEMGKYAEVLEISLNSARTKYGDDKIGKYGSGHLFENEETAIYNDWLAMLAANGMPVSESQRQVILWRWAGISQSENLFTSDVDVGFLNPSLNLYKMNSTINELRSKSKAYIDEIRKGDDNDVWSDAFGLSDLEQILSYHLDRRDHLDVVQQDLESQILDLNRQINSSKESARSATQISNELSCEQVLLGAN